MLGHIYYAIGLFVLVSLITYITRFKKIIFLREWVEKFKNVTGRDPKREDYRSEEELNLFIGISILGTVEFIWLFCGLLTSSWYVFLSIFVYAMILNLLIKPIKFTLFGKIIIFHFIILKFLLYLYLIINHFHLHYDILSIIKSYI